MWLLIVSDGVLRRDRVAGPPADAQLKITGNHRGKAQLPQSSRHSHGLQQTQRGHDVQGPLCTCTKHQNLLPQPSRARCLDAVLAPSCPGRCPRTAGTAVLNAVPDALLFGRAFPRHLTPFGLYNYSAPSNALPGWHLEEGMKRLPKRFNGETEATQDDPGSRDN